MKKETAIKIMKGYIRNLGILEQEAKQQGDNAIVGQYRIDRSAFQMALASLEGKE